MNRSMKVFLPALIMGLVLSSCTHYYYAPNAHNVPLFQEKGEANISVGIGTGDEFTGYDFQGSYSFLNHLGVMVNGFYARGGDKVAHNHGRGYLIEGGLGVYHPVMVSGRSDLVLECYAGYGQGNVFNEYSLGNFVDLDFARYFVQPALGWKWDWDVTHLSFGHSSRIVMMDYLKAQYSQDFTEQNVINQLNFTSREPNQIWYEPSFFLQFGVKNVSLRHQFVYSSEKNRNLSLPKENVNFNTSLVFSF